VCGQYGLRPSNIITLSDTFSTIMLGLVQNLTFHNHGGIIIGYDFDCHKSNGCSGKY